MRIAGTNIPNEKKILFSLPYIYGIGPTLSRKILEVAKVDGNIRTKDLSNEQQDSIRAIVEKSYKTEGDLRREVQANIKTLKDIKCYRGIRHMKHLPVRGQNTKRNTRTVRGNTRKTMGSGRKTSGLKT
ncbi:MAG: 30S ribosomal protein S13 [Candidatus Magasanikbacteria bacterium]|nr:30S ribosomal protein S13 [Candidatus Magasanikbacteria bacterium]